MAGAPLTAARAPPPEPAKTRQAARRAAAVRPACQPARLTCPRRLWELGVAWVVNIARVLLLASLGAFLFCYLGDLRFTSIVPFFTQAIHIKPASCRARTVRLEGGSGTKTGSPASRPPDTAGGAPGLAGCPVLGRDQAVSEPQADDKTHSFVHSRTLLPRHPLLPPIGNAKV